MDRGRSRGVDRDTAVAARLSASDRDYRAAQVRAQTHRPFGEEQLLSFVKIPALPRSETLQRARFCRVQGKRRLRDRHEGDSP